MTLKYIINKTDSNVSLVDSRFLVPKGGWIDVNEEVATHADVIDAKRKGWVEIQDYAPGTAAEGPKVDIKFQNDALKGSALPPGVEAKSAEELATPIQIDEDGNKVEAAAPAKATKTKASAKKAAEDLGNFS